jgi:hypothetical protein
LTDDESNRGASRVLLALDSTSGWSRGVLRGFAGIAREQGSFECELTVPPLSSVAVPWQSLGESAARLVQLGLRATAIAGRRVLVEPSDVVTRRSSDAFANPGAYRRN